MQKLLRATAVYGVVLLSPVLLACSIQVDKDEDGHKADVSVTTPGGRVQVKGGIDSPDTGLAVYPGATLAQKDDSKEAADVNVSVPFVNVHVTAAEYESDDAPDTVAAFYRSEMKKLGDVVECHGDIDFKNDRLRCRDRLGRPGQTQFGVGTERRHRIVAIEPKGNRTKLSLVSVETSDKS